MSLNIYFSQRCMHLSKLGVHIVFTIAVCLYAKTLFKRLFIKLYKHKVYHLYIRGLLFKFVDFHYSRSEVFDRVLKVI